jgi:hypothetical protein
MLTAFGLEAFMVNVLGQALVASLLAAAALTGHDQWRSAQPGYYRAGELEGT